MTSWTLADGIPIGPVYCDGPGRRGLPLARDDERRRALRRRPLHAVERALPGARCRAATSARSRWSRDGTFWIGFDRIGGGVTVGALAARRAHASRRPAPRHGRRRPRFSKTRPGACGPSATARSIAGATAGGTSSATARSAAPTVVSVREDARGTIWIGTRQGVFRTRDGEAFELVEPGIARETSQSADGDAVDDRPGARRPASGRAARRRSASTGGACGCCTTRAATCGSARPVRDSGACATPRPPARRSSSARRCRRDSRATLVQTLLEDRDGNIWVGTMLGLHSLTPQELTPLASGALVRAILPEPDGLGVGGNRQRPDAVPP